MTNKLKYFIGNWKMFGVFNSFKIINKINKYCYNSMNLHNKKIGKLILSSSNIGLTDGELIFLGNLVFDIYNQKEFYRIFAQKIKHQSRKTQHIKVTNVGAPHDINPVRLQLEEQQRGR